MTISHSGWALDMTQIMGHTPPQHAKDIEKTAYPYPRQGNMFHMKVWVAGGDTKTHEATTGSPTKRPCMRYALIVT